MRLSHLLPAALLVAAGLTPASAADLSKIDRSLKDEPKYHTKAPKYCLLVFGPEARTHVWLVRDGDVMHVLASPDGKSAKAWRQVKGSHGSFNLGDVTEDGGKVRHKDLRLGRHYYECDDVSVRVAGVGKQMAGHDRNGKLAFAARAKDAPVVHFNGPLTLDLYREQRPLMTNRRVQLTAVVGTHGVGPGTFALFCCDSYGNVWPTAEIEFPAKKADDPPVVVRIKLEND
jgi:hypothetical protein